MFVWTQRQVGRDHATGRAVGQGGGRRPRSKKRRGCSPLFFAARGRRRSKSGPSRKRARGTPGPSRTRGPRRLAAPRLAEVKVIASPSMPGVPRAVFEVCSAITPVGRQFLTHRCGGAGKPGGAELPGTAPARRLAPSAAPVDACRAPGKIAAWTAAASGVRLGTPQQPPHPVPRVVTTAKRPSSEGRDGVMMDSDCGGNMI